MILVPVKNLAHAKQRLAAVLEPGERTALAQAMLEDVLQTLAGWAKCLPVAVVTGDSFARCRARSFGFEVIEDPHEEGESEAIAFASCACASRGVSTTLVIPGDIPLLQAAELEEVFAAAPPEGAVLVPSFDGRGTNAVLRRPADLIPLTFGGDSFERHLSRVGRTGRPAVVLRLPGIALDVDTPDDLALLLAAASRTRTQRLLQEWNVPERLQPAASP